MPFPIEVGYAKKRVNSVAVPAILNSKTYQVVLKEKTSIIKPVLILQVSEYTIDSLAFANYCSIPIFKRYYWITDVKTITSTIVEISCEVDVLASWEQDILNSNAFVVYSDTHYDSMLSDTRIPKTCASTIARWTKKISAFSENGVFILTAASSESDGSTGITQSYALSKNNMKTLSGDLYDPSFLDKIKDDLYSPTQAIANCIWIPLNSSLATDSFGNITFGAYDIGAGAHAKTIYESEEKISIPMYYHSDVDESSYDYRNCEPFSEYSIYLPGVGLTDLPMTSLILMATENNVDITIKYSISILTGDITYYIIGDNSNAEILCCKGNIGVQLQVPQAQFGTRDFVSGALSTVASITAATLVPEYAPFAIGMGLHGTASAIMGATQSTYTVSGGSSGWMPINRFNYINVIRRNYKLSDIPANVSEVIGRPSFSKRKLGDLHGYTQTISASVRTGETGAGATLTEIETINNFLNGGVYIG